jgi:hypothetical protein
MQTVRSFNKISYVVTRVKSFMGLIDNRWDEREREKMSLVGWPGSQRIFGMGASETTWVAQTVTNKRKWNNGGNWERGARTIIQLHVTIRESIFSGAQILQPGLEGSSPSIISFARSNLFLLRYPPPDLVVLGTRTQRRQKQQGSRRLRQDGKALAV